MKLWITLYLRHSQRERHVGGSELERGGLNRHLVDQVGRRPPFLAHEPILAWWLRQLKGAQMTDSVLDMVGRVLNI